MRKKKEKIQWEIGIDEAGRGPLAGPVAVGVVLVPVDFDWARLPGVGDSKQMSEQKREVVYMQAMQLKKAGLLQSVVMMGSATQIDTKGITEVIRECLAKGMRHVSTRSFLELGASTRKDLVLATGQVLVKLDGGLRAPAEWVRQETIIKGDVKEKVIGLASILAKVTRDRYMKRVAKRPTYAPYDFARHKGYGTKMHRETILRYGFSPEHRHTFCKNIKSVL